MIDGFLAGILVGIIYGCGVASRVKNFKVQIACTLLLISAIIMLGVFYII